MSGIQWAPPNGRIWSTICLAVMGLPSPSCAPAPSIEVEPVVAGSATAVAVRVEDVEHLIGPGVLDVAAFSRIRTEFGARPSRELADQLSDAIRCYDASRLDDISRTKLEHLVRSLFVLGVLEESGLVDLERAALMLGASDERERIRGFRELCRDDRYQSLEQLAIKFQDLSAAEDRLRAGHLAKLVTVMRGPSPACDSVVRNILVDRDPRVCVRFIVDAVDLGRLEVVRRLVSRISDERVTQRSSGFLWCPAVTVGDSIWRILAQKGIIVPPVEWTTNETKPTPEEVKALVAQLPPRGVQGDWPDRGGWNKVSDSVRLLRMGVEECIEIGELSIGSTLLMLDQYIDSDGAPRQRVRVAVRIQAPGEHETSMTLGSDVAEDLQVFEGVTGEHARVRCMVAPTGRDTTRVRLVVWWR